MHTREQIIKALEGALPADGINREGDIIALPVEVVIAAIEVLTDD